MNNPLPIIPLECVHCGRADCRCDRRHAIIVAAITLIVAAAVLIAEWLGR
jgi:hypothetical protein